MIFVILLLILFMIFMVFFPLFWALAICGCWFLPLTKFSKVLINVLILAMLCGGIAFLFFDNNMDESIENEKDEEELTKSGNSILFVSKNENLIALIGVKDVIKDNAKEVISDLKNRKINVVMITGDRKETAVAIAKDCGLIESEEDIALTSDELNKMK